ncbi:MAG: c-type cytochrome, partial [Verrucomicrobiota bacterium]
ADPSEPFSAARPEWYFLFLFEFLKYFPGGTEVIGAMVIPGLVFLLVAAMPLIARWKGGHRFNLAALSVLLAGAAGLTYLALRQDARDPGFRRAFLAAEAEARRVVELAGRPEGIPPSGAVSLLREDPLTQGPRLFARHCASCHRYDGHDGTGQERLAEHPVAAGETGASLQARFQMTAEDWLRLNPGQPGEPAVGTRVRVLELPSAPDLKGFGDRAWAAGILDPKRVATHAFYGGTRFAEGKMVKWVQGKLAKKLPAQADDLAKVVAALSAEAALPAQAALDRAESARIEEGRRLLRDEFSCTDCHQFRQPDADASAPDLTGWGSREWLVGVIRNPAHPRFYGSKNDRMPRFGEDGSLNPAQIGLLADWLRGDWYRTPAR